MKLLIEEYPYDVADVTDVLEGLFNLQDVEQKVSVSYVGYYYNPHEKVRDVVFILPKVLIDEKGMVFGKHDPRDLIHLDEAKIDEHEKKFLFEFAVWIHRAIVVFNASHPDNRIVLHRQIESPGRGSRKKKSNTLLDVILSLILFNREHQQFFTFILKNIHSGFNKINWGKTIARTSAVVQDGSPTYLKPVNKKRNINFDEELIVIYFSILHYIQETFGFRVNINYGFDLIGGAAFRKYLDGYGKRRLRQIKYKYFSDTAVKLWDLCYAFFDKAYRIRMNASQSEYLLVKSFHVVFEAMIDELIGEKNIPPGLKEQDDGKLVDHFYTYESLLKTDREDDDIYYIGDSKYYKLGNSLGKEPLYKQRTYARNVIQWNLGIWLDGKPDMNDPYQRVKIFDEVTEGYNIIPNFFISANIDCETLSYEDRTVPHAEQPEISRQFNNRLYDRDTLLLSHYDVNFLFVLALYARNNSGAKAAWKRSVRETFRKAVQEMLFERFEFYAMAAHPDVDAEQYFRTHFQETLGKTFRPYEKEGIYSLALDRGYPEENKKLREKLAENFYIVPVKPGKDPTPDLENERSGKGVKESPDGVGKFLFGIVPKHRKDSNGKDVVRKEFVEFQKKRATEFSMKFTRMGDISKVKYFVPMFDGGISGYYKIKGISVGMRQEEFANENGETVSVMMPRLNLRLGAYTELSGSIVSLPNYSKWNGQIHTLTEVRKPRLFHLKFQFEA